MITPGAPPDMLAQMRTWTGPCPGLVERGPVPASRWPYGPPAAHETICLLFAGATHCDCDASSASGDEFGVGA